MCLVSAHNFALNRIYGIAFITISLLCDCFFPSFQLFWNRINGVEFLETKKYTIIVFTLIIFGLNAISSSCSSIKRISGAPSSNMADWERKQITEKGRISATFLTCMGHKKKYSAIADAKFVLLKQKKANWIHMIPKCTLWLWLNEMESIHTKRKAHQ